MSEPVSLDSIAIEDLDSAREVRKALRDLIKKNAVVTVADFYVLLGLASHFTDSKWGWTEFPEIDITQTEGGYQLSLPKPRQLL